MKNNEHSALKILYFICFKYTNTNIVIMSKIVLYIKYYVKNIVQINQWELILQWKVCIIIDKNIFYQQESILSLVSRYLLFIQGN